MDRQKKLDHGGESLQNNLDEVLSMSITLQSQPAVFQPQPGTFPDYKPSTLTDEVRTANLGDKRLNKRLAAVLEKLGANPKLSIPAATDGRAEMEAAYRFFDNDEVTPQKILQSHIAATHERISQCGLVVLVQDTSEMDLTRPQQQVAGAGPMDSNVRFGAFIHPLIAFDSTGIPLGTVWQKTWTRESIETTKTPAEKAKERKNTPIEKKESVRWIEGLRAARVVAAACPNTTCVCVSDSESDIYELFSEPRSAKQPNGTSTPEVELIVRGCQTRSTETGNWLNDVRSTSCLEFKSVQVSLRKAKIAVTKDKRGQSRDARTANVEVRAATVTLLPPDRFDRQLLPLTVNVVLVEEPNPPEDCEPIQWLLVTTLPIATLEQVQQIVKYYCLRWQIEIFFRTLKSGCRVEERLFERLSRTLNCLAVYSIVAWRVMYLCRLGRECPDISCEVVFTEGEWKSVYSVVKRSQPLPENPPTLNAMIRMVASLGGFIDRPKNEPGPQTLWIGLQRLNCFSLAWDSFGPEGSESSANG